MKTQLAYRAIFAIPLLALVPVLGAACAASTSTVESGDGDGDDAVAGADESLSASDAIARAEEWVSVKLHYCQAPNHQRDFDAACSRTCERHANSKWDPYRSDCSGLVSWAWGLPAPGRTTLQFAPFESDITKTISASDLEPGDAINNSDHVMLFKHWVTKGHRAVFIEEPGCSSATPYAHEVTTDVSLLGGSSIHVSWNGMTFHAIRYNHLSNAKPKPPEPKMHADRVGVSSWATDRLDLFARDDDEGLVHKYWSGGKWHGWETLDHHQTGSSPAAVSWSSGRIDVFAQGTTGHLIHKWYDEGKWHDWENLGGSLTSAPTAVSQAEGSLDVFARDDHDELVHKYFRPQTGWSGFEHLGGKLASSPAAVSWAAGRIDVFARDAKDNVAHIYFREDPHGWSDWSAIHGPIANGPVVTSWGEGRLDLFGTDDKGALVHRWYTEGAWVDHWENLGGTLDAAPMGVSWGPGRIDVFSRGGGDILVHKYFGASGWSDWKHEGNMPR